MIKRLLLFITTFKVIIVKSEVGDQKAPFSIATTLRYKGGCYSFPWIAPLPLIYTLYGWVLSKEVSSTIFKVFGMTRPGIEPSSTGLLANTLPTRPISQIIGLMGRFQGHHLHHHHVMPLTLFRHFSLSFIASGRSSGLHPVSSHSCCMYVCLSWPSCFCLAMWGGPSEGHYTLC